MSETSLTYEEALSESFFQKNNLTEKEFDEFVDLANKFIDESKSILGVNFKEAYNVKTQKDYYFKHRYIPLFKMKMVKNNEFKKLIESYQSKDINDKYSVKIMFDMQSNNIANVTMNIEKKNKTRTLKELAELAAIEEASREIVVKTYNDSFLYRKGDYEKNIFDFIMRAEMINKKDPSFDNIITMVKRQPYSFLVNVLISDRIVLLRRMPQGLPRSFKVFAGKDIRNGKDELKVYIDVSGLIIDNGGAYDIKGNKLNEFVSYLTSAMTYTIYHVDPMRLIGNTKLVESGTSCFALLFTHIIDYLRAGGVENVRGKTLYLSSIYYQLSVLGMKDGQSIRNRALKISKLTSKEAEVLEYILDSDSFDSIDTFIKSLSKVLRIPDLRIDNFIDKWVYLYKSGTQFAVEYFPAFASLLTNAYHGAYINNQVTIEKVTNNGKDMVAFVQALLQIGRELI